MKEITVSELKKLKDVNADFQLIDVREQHEVDSCAIGGEHIPMGDVMGNINKISKSNIYKVFCLPPVYKT